MRKTVMSFPRYFSMALACMLAASAMGQDLPARIAECEACHGPGGVSTEDDVPSLAGREAGDIQAAIEQFQFYERHCSTNTYRRGNLPKTPMNMCNVANTLGKEDVVAISEYFATQ